ncbi:uncharacterized protein LOC121259535 [Juglans microcarpa x Juglans regia]|uniref:uncharacterized protein LOC121259535 n=1 Tax=Juglans microcarpa x Juglans regia TaxID=2249226 RepID=UPI001B7E134A|nr:uncharacterized protein LOC121259535 [Juglans microcarpa x Juglans regia]XP_041017089.1 uncharacterized protein LOC121259535 [Juglans microcarpa x Juglans regia]
MRLIRICKSLVSLSLENPLPHLHETPTLSCLISVLYFSSSKPKKSTSTVTVLDYLINQHQFSPEAALKASSSFTYLRNPEKADSVLSFFKESGFSQTHIEQVVKRMPKVLSAKLAVTIKPIIKIFQDSGFARDDIAEIVCGDPWILTRSAGNQIGPSILVLKSILDSNEDIVRVLKSSGWFLNHDLNKTMMPNIEFLKRCEISSSQIVTYLFNFPRLFLLKPESIQAFVKKVDGMGFDRKSKMFLCAIRTVSSMSEENWELKLELFRSLGFSEKDILDVFRRKPQVFAISERKIKEVTGLLFSAPKVDISYFVDHPELLISSVERRLKPRLRVLEILEKKNVLNRKPCLTTVCRMPEQKFLNKFVLPYSKELAEVNEACGGSYTIGCVQ